MLYRGCTCCSPVLSQRDAERSLIPYLFFLLLFYKQLHTDILLILFLLLFWVLVISLFISLLACSNIRKCLCTLLCVRMFIFMYSVCKRRLLYAFRRMGNRGTGFGEHCVAKWRACCTHWHVCFSLSWQPAHPLQRPQLSISSGKGNLETQKSLNLSIIFI